jgi:hypothetical protein
VSMVSQGGAGMGLGGRSGAGLEKGVVRFALRG